MKTLSCTITCIACALVLCSVSSAEIRINPLISVGVTDGGDRIGTTHILPSLFPEVVGAGDSMHLFGGVSLLWPVEQAGSERSGVGLQIQGGIADGGDSSGEDKAGLNREPIEVLGIVERPNWRFGAGVSWHFSPELDGSEVIPETRFNDATGMVVQFDWLLERFTVGLRYVEIDYDVPSFSLDGSHWGISGGYRFGRLE